MEGVFFNVDNGFIEGVVRGYRNGLLTGSQYINLTQCDTLEDLKLQLASTDYGNFLSNVSSDALTTTVIQERAADKLYQEFQYVRDQSSGVTKKFMDFITYGYMIDNVALMITGTIHDRDKAEILGRCHPLGWFETLPTLTVATDLESLYDTVLVDTPLATYFRDCFDDADELDDLNIEIIRNKLYCAYLQDFYDFVSTEIDEPARENLKELLEFEADRRAINISLNSLQSSDIINSDLKRDLLPKLGKLYPVASEQLATHGQDFESVRQIVDTVHTYRGIFENGNLEDHFYKLEMELCRDAFTQQFTVSTIWAWMKSREQEVRNITWIAECIAQNQKSKINNYISVY
ncbi:v-type proton ATPase subunit d [Kluyveromyces marxianus]|uniref:V-type proton ATPase subunit n=2 Tax=Kluyveromyces marxianus TaxID=4911 RepID=W0TED8_KLUMD|nr:v-type proton ATPase subunit d [Kluyveromyces marxianus DMKU3-1042]QGN16193.1 v-type proton ATPase subunit d [Kluyveromyces marxianus]BAO40464.1 v-type proton ATPase subunit d [Kluyveromyces marxianus DMKU3-1042]BAP71949.1 v-type proton ATPase subunit d [Kluyveromyces marxianus]